MSAGGRGDRVAGLVVAGAAVVAAVLALGLRVAFTADPLGPRAAPLVAAGLMAAGGLALALRPAAPWSLPDGPTARRLALAVGVFLGYVPLLPLLGFVPATTLLVGGLGRLFGGGAVRVLAAGLAVSVLLHLLFTVALGLPLPAGAWTEAG